MKFNILLPKHSSESSINAATRSNWTALKSFILTHELTHRNIWLECGRKFESAMRSLSAPDCPTLDARFGKAFDEMLNRCMGQQKAFDVAEQSHLKRQPMVQTFLASR